MATNTPAIENVTSSADKAKLGASLALVLGALAAYYLIDANQVVMRWAAFLALLALAVVVFFLSETGRRLIGFGQDSIKEAKKVVWPTRQEAIQMTGLVFAFVVAMALFLFLTDKTLEWIIYGVILGWRN